MPGDEDLPDTAADAGRPRQSCRLWAAIPWLVVAGWTAWWVREQAVQGPAGTVAEPRGDFWDPASSRFPLQGIGALLTAVAAFLLVRGAFHSRVKPVRGPAAPYAQAAALWLLLDVARRLPGDRGLGSRLDPYSYFLLPFLLAGLACVWPVMQGINFRRVAVSLGLVRGAGFWREVAVGLLAYPVLVLLEEAALRVLNPPEPPPHLAIEWLIGEEPFLRIYALGTVLLYPLVEEVEFRGLLYRMFRDGTRRLPNGAGIAASAIGTAFLFAVCHLQGWGEIPVLMVMGVCTALLREWRRSLVAPTVLHVLRWGDILAWLAGLGLL